MRYDGLLQENARYKEKLNESSPIETAVQPSWVTKKQEWLNHLNKVYQACVESEKEDRTKSQSTAHSLLGNIQSRERSRNPK